MTETSLIVRSYTAGDETHAIDLWRRSWQATYSDIDFAERLDWWRERWRTDTAMTSKVLVAERGDLLVGFVTFNPTTGYLDQLVVAPEAWGEGIGARLMSEAFRLAPHGIDLHVNQDNSRALRFYQKLGFTIVAESVNPRSGLPVYLMRWMPS